MTVLLACHLCVCFQGWCVIKLRMTHSCVSSSVLQLLMNLCVELAVFAKMLLLSSNNFCTFLQLQENQDEIENMMNAIFKGVFVHRYRYAIICSNKYNS